MLFQKKIQPNIRKIAVLRASGIGDFLFSLPALEALRSAYPNAEIVLLGQQWHADLLTNRRSPIDRVVTVPPMKGLYESVTSPDASSDEIESFIQAMKQEAFDLAIQLHGGGKHSNPLILKLHSRITVGSKAEDAPPLNLYLPYIYFQSEIIRCLEVVSLIGAVTITLEPRIAVTQKDLWESETVVAQSNRPLVALNPGAGDPRRRWPAHQFAEVGNVLAKKGAQVILTGAGFDRELTDQVTERMDAEVINAAGSLSLGGLAGLLSRCDLVISNDSGPLHLAAACGASTIGLYWCANQITAGLLTRAHHRPLISWRLDCPLCANNIITSECNHRVSFLTDISTDQVLQQAFALQAF